jgi:hypothetical protein
VKRAAVAPRHRDVVAGFHVAQEAEMGVAVRGIDCDAALASIRRLLHMPGTEGERLTAAAREHDGAGVQALDLDPRHRPGVRPGPRLDDPAGRDRLVERALEQHLRDQRLGVDVGALPDQQEAEEGDTQCSKGPNHETSLMASCARGPGESRARD